MAKPRPRPSVPVGPRSPTDSGIAVAVLGGRPGIHSARFAASTRPTRRTSRSSWTRCGAAESPRRIRVRARAGRAGRRTAGLRGDVPGPLDRHRRVARGLRLRPDLRPGRTTAPTERTMAELTPPRRMRSATRARRKSDARVASLERMSTGPGLENERPGAGRSPAPDRARRGGGFDEVTARRGSRRLELGPDRPENRRGALTGSIAIPSPKPFTRASI